MRVTVPKLALPWIAASTLAWANPAQADPEVRYWMGAPNPARRDDAAHLQFIRTTLAPGTVLAGAGALSSYVLYLPPTGPLPDRAMLDALPFSEAAVLHYLSPEAFQKARTELPEYGPVHYLPDGFDRSVSCTAPIVPWDAATGAPRVNACGQEATRVAYALAPGPPLADWSTGATVVVFALRAEGTADEEWLEGVARSFTTFEAPAAGGELTFDGEFARVGTGHLVYFIHLNDPAAASRAVERAARLIESDMVGVGFVYHSAVAVTSAPFAAGWGEALTPGHAVRVLVPRPGMGGTAAPVEGTAAGAEMCQCKGKCRRSR